METDWAENRAKLPQDIIRSTLGKRVRFALLHRRARQVPHPRRAPAQRRHRDLSQPPRHRRGLQQRPQGPTVWQPRPADPQLEAEMLRRLMLRLGVQEEQVKTAGRHRRRRRSRHARASSPNQPTADAAGRRRLRPRLAPRRPGAGSQRLHRRGPRPRAGPVLRALRRSGAGRQGRARLLGPPVQLRPQERRAERPGALPRAASRAKASAARCRC